MVVLPFLSSFSLSSLFSLTSISQTFPLLSPVDNNQPFNNGEDGPVFTESEKIKVIAIIVENPIEQLVKTR